MTVSWVLLILSGYMILALLSELSEFPGFNRSAWLMLGMGSVWLGVNLLLGIIMLRKWYGKPLLTINT
jgi:NO-binding membrane sensor protein with MHYT domain